MEAAAFQAAHHAGLALEARATDNLTETNVDIICAWPVSGQYGPGTRFLFYMLVVGCVVGKNTPWLRNVCLAAALVVSAVAAIHGIVLAIMHQPDAVDLDIYGALQLVSIGILAAPVTVRISKTYFNDPGRNLIFSWTALLLAGLMSLTVEFFRVKPVKCRVDAANNWLAKPEDFDYESDEKCGLICVKSDEYGPGPFSPIRTGATGELVVVPQPHTYSLSMGILTSAGCSIPAVLMLVSTWLKIREQNRQKQRGYQFAEDEILIEGTNGATLGHMKSINQSVRDMLRGVELLVFTGLIAALLVVGELNFWSKQLMQGAEPMSSVGQWGPIAGTVTAVIGSLYVMATKNPPRWLQMSGHSRSESDVGACICTCSNHKPHRLPPGGSTVAWPGAAAMSPMFGPVGGGGGGGGGGGDGGPYSPHMTNAVSPQDSIMQQQQNPSSSSTPLHEVGWSRGRAAKLFNDVNRFLGTAAQPDAGSGFAKRGRAFPEIPGEAQRNFKLVRQRSTWDNHVREVREVQQKQQLERERERSRANSVRAASIPEEEGGEGDPGEEGEGGPAASRTSSRSPRRHPTSPAGRRNVSDGNISPLEKSATVDFSPLAHHNSSPTAGGLRPPPNTFRRDKSPRRSTLPVQPTTTRQSLLLSRRRRESGPSSSPQSPPPIRIITAEPNDDAVFVESPTMEAGPSTS